MSLNRKRAVRLLVLCLTFPVFQQVYAQSRVDSLLALLRFAPAYAQAGLFNELCTETRGQYPETAMKYATAAKASAIKNGDKKNLALAHKNIGILLYLSLIHI